MEDQRRAIKEYCEQRGIREVVHFTHRDNLPTIFQYGLLSVKELRNRGIPYRFNDLLGLHGRSDVICLSISFPNYRMFFRVRKSVEDSGEDPISFVVLSLKPDLLWEFSCLFCFTNAASNDIRYIIRYSPDTLQGISALDKMFAESRNYRGKVILRQDLNIPENYPTDPQAEVLCLEPIPYSYIQAVYHNNYPQISTKIPDKHRTLVQPKPEYFSRRSDWQYWRTQCDWDQLVYWF